MPLYVIERRYAEQLELSSDAVRQLEDINADEGVHWLFSFLSADQRQSYCLYEAPSPDEIMAAARRAKLTDYAPEFLEPELTWAQALALQLKSRAAQALFRAGPGELALAQVAQRLDPLTREVARLSRFSVPNRLYAYCFCEAQ